VVAAPKGILGALAPLAARWRSVRSRPAAMAAVQEQRHA